MNHRTPLSVRIGTAQATAPGHSASGDLQWVRIQERSALVAVIDGVGHGELAAQAAELARHTIESTAHCPLTQVVQRCHEALRRTRGVVLSLVAIDLELGLLSWVGVGNVQAVLYRPAVVGAGHREELLLRPGVVGAQLPTLQTQMTQVEPRDLLILATDGIRSDFADEPVTGASPQALAGNLLARFRRPTDDALVLVAQLL